ncbi:sperm-associated antigen 1 [Danio aesculapii]|uniref:sperm-associated antigen 1 n=1 Tax=Danio aesculapii TaxID=1142201 RepID=UPI0024BFB7FC|nr:sperm-associated antigen 1 [Danio aesculapii]
MSGVMSSSSVSVPVEHLDYSFIQSCSDLKQLEQILRVLRSGQEGVYPHLIGFCERRIETLNPRSAELRTENHPHTAACYTEEEWRSITEDLQVWERSVRMTEAVLMRSSIFSGEQCVLPVRSSDRALQTNQEKRKTVKTSCVPRPYTDWDRLDVDSACAGESVRNAPAAAVCPELQQRLSSSTALTALEKQTAALREKDKANEAYRSRDYEEALEYYCRSLSLASSAAVFNNRAQTLIRLQQWPAALRDCEAVLQLEPHNIKALLRRATVHKHLGHRQESHDDLRAVLQIEPQNKTALKLLADESDTDPPQQRRSTGRRIPIQEVEEEEEGAHSEHSREGRGIMGNTHSSSSSRGGGAAHGDAHTEDTPSGHAYTEDTPSGHTHTEDTPSGHTHTEDTPSGHTHTEDTLSGHTHTEDTPSGHTHTEDTPSRHIHTEDTPSQHTHTEDMPSGHTHNEDTPPGHTHTEDTPPGHTHTEDTSSGQMEATPPGHIYTEATPPGHTYTKDTPPGHTHMTDEEHKETAEQHTQDNSEHTAAVLELLRHDGKVLFCSGSYEEAVEKYTQSLQLNTHTCTAYTNRALCYIKLQRFTEARQDCDSALHIEPTNKKAFYRRALANKGLKDYLSCRSDLQQVLRLDASVTEAQRLLMELTHLMEDRRRRTVHITEVEDEDDEGVVSSAD